MQIKLVHWLFLGLNGAAGACAYVAAHDPALAVPALAVGTLVGGVAAVVGLFQPSIKS